MKKEIGLWIDHRKAVIVIVKDGEEKIKSNMEKHVRSSSGDGCLNRVGLRDDINSASFLQKVDIR